MAGNADDMTPTLGAPNPMTGVVVGSLVPGNGRHGDQRTYAVVEQPGHGFVSLWPTGGFIYTPDPRARLDAYRSGTELTDRFTATVTDVDGTSTGLNVCGVPVHPARAAIVATVPVGDQPMAPALNPDDSRVYVTHADEPIITAIDAKTYTAMETVPLGALPTAVSFSPDGRCVFVAHAGGSVSVIDADLLTVVDVLDVMPAAALVPHVDDAAETLAAISAAVDLDVVDVTTGVAVNAPGTCAFIANRAYGTVSVVKIAVPPTARAN
jgi:YVTN family beta-propeller protein/VCBS repeat-containing protein